MDFHLRNQKKNKTHTYINRRIESSIKSEIKKLENWEKKGQNGKLILVTAVVLQMHAYVSTYQIVHFY